MQAGHSIDAGQCQAPLKKNIWYRILNENFSVVSVKTLCHAMWWYPNIFIVGRESSV